MIINSAVQSIYDVTPLVEGGYQLFCDYSTYNSSYCNLYKMLLKNTKIWVTSFIDDLIRIACRDLKYLRPFWKKNHNFESICNLHNWNCEQVRSNWCLNLSNDFSHEPKDDMEVLVMIFLWKFRFFWKSRLFTEEGATEVLNKSTTFLFSIFC